MASIQTNVGLMSGIPIGDTVDKLMALAAKPRDMLTDRTTALKKEQAAVTELSAYLLATRYLTDNLGKDDIYNKSKASSSDDGALGATVTGDAVPGVYQFTPVRTAQAEQLLSSGFRSNSEPIGAGTLTFRFGDNVERAATLDLLNGNSGLARGKFRLTDRSGASAEIDLSTAQTMDDVLDAINQNTAINVTAIASGDHIRLIDNTGQSQSNLMVQEIGRGTTAASLGLNGINSASAVADGSDLVRLTQDTDLSALNDGNGFTANPALSDIDVQLRDGTKGVIDFSPIKTGSSQSVAEKTLGDVLNAINQAMPGKLKAEVAPDGKRIVVTDLTQGSGTFALGPLFDSPALRSLGLDGQAQGGTITGRRIVGGLKTVLLSSLNGGSGLGQLGSLQLTDRSGQTAAVDLSQAETLDDVLEKINGSGVGITARINDARNGLQLTDATGASAGNLIVADADSSGTAAKLKIAANTSQTAVNSGDLHLQVISANTSLSDLNGGAGIGRGRITIFDSQGNQAKLDLRRTDLQTVGDVVREINRLGVSVQAKINETGDGILISDLGHGKETMHVADVDSTAAADLHLAGSPELRDIGGVSTQVINGTMTQTVQVSSTDTLDNLQAKIDALHAGVSVKTITDGSSKPYRLQLTGNTSGRTGQLVVDTSGVGFDFQETSRARDALLAMGSSGASSGLLLSSSTNVFKDAISGVKLEVKQPSATPVTITVSQSDTDLSANVKTFVDNYNKFRQKLNDDMAYDVQQNQKSVLTGDAAALRLDTELSHLLSSRVTGTRSIQSLGELGIHLKDDGTLEYDDTQLKAKFAEDPEGVKDFFTHAKTGFSAKFQALSEQLVGQDVSLMAQRYKALDRKILENADKIDFMNKRLDSQRLRMLTQFYNMELAIGKMQNNMNVLNSIQLILGPGTTSSSSSSSSSSSGSA
jgi:flagellar hook-associated protein 2